MSPSSADRVTWPTVVAFGAPAIGAGYMYLILSLYVLKFSTDVLLIAPGVMGIIFAISRVWDAISDPLAGYYSDRTRVRMGRRRSWMLASVLPISLFFYMVFAPPAALTGSALTLWMGASVIGFYAAMTVFFVPHLSLGAELSTDYHERSRIFGIRHACYTLGAILCLYAMYLLIEAEQAGVAQVRALARELGVGTALVMAGLVVYAVWRIRERPEFQGRVQSRPFGAFQDVWRNPHARLLIAATFIEHVGGASIGALTLYVAQYVVGTPGLAVIFILCYLVPSTVSVPLWIPLSRRLGKKRLWIWSMAATGIAFGQMFWLPFIDSESVRIALIAVLAMLAGLAAGAGGTIGPSIQGDVIDYDELQTGERKEGSYFAAWNFVYKSAIGVMLLLTGFVLEYSGFVPNAEQTMQVKLALVALYGLVPLVCYSIGALLLTRFRLDEAEYARIRAALDERRSGA